MSSIVCLADVRLRRRGWSNHELAQFHCVIASLCEVGFALETDSGVTDEGDPWFVLCDGDAGEIFGHFARIGGEYVVGAPCLDSLLTGTTLRQLVDHFIDVYLCRRCGIRPQSFCTCRAIARRLAVCAFGRPAIDAQLRQQLVARVAEVGPYAAAKALGVDRKTAMKHHRNNL